MRTSYGFPAFRRVRGALAACVAAVVLAACATGPVVDPANDPAPEGPIEQGSGGGAGTGGGVTSDDDFDLVAFCDRAAPLRLPVERDFVGTDEHVQQFRDLRAVAPGELDAPIALLIDHYELDVSPSDPESQNFENFPTDVQDAALLLGNEINALC